MRYFWIILCSALFLQQPKAANSSDSISGNKPVIEEFVKHASYRTTGFLNIYEQNNHYYMEVPNDKLGRDILVTITILKGSARKERTAEMRFGYGGDSVYDKLIRLTKRGNYIEIVIPELSYTEDSTYMYRKSLENKELSVFQALPIIAKSASASLVDITDMLNSDNQLFSLKAAAFELKLGEYQQDQNEIVDIKSFPTNINFITNCSYQLTDSKKEFPSSRWEVASSWLLLPEKPMRPQVSDARVGFFAYPLSGLPLQKDQLQLSAPIAAHWRLEPKPEDKERYMRGELVEPIKPIVYYIDRATPTFLVPYLIKAVNNWQSAFEKAGFKNAIHAELAPTDSIYSEGDARYSLVSYKASPIPNAYGPLVVDPRSGEILTSHIAIYHSVLTLLQRWYFVMCGTTDKRARQYPLPQDLLGELAETVLTHEVGHTLGLRHNFIGSTAFATDSLRDVNFVRKNGLGASIMDYQRFNYIAQPEDKMSPSDLLPHIGVYDNFAIEWAYRLLPDNQTIAQQTEQKRRWVDEKRKDHRLLYIEETTIGDPRVQSEDSSNDDVKANTYGIENLKRIMAHLEEWSPKNEKDYFTLRKRYLSVQSQYLNYVGHVLNIIGGHYSDNPGRDEKLIQYQSVPREKQLAALDFMDKYVFRPQNWLFPESLMDKTKCSYDIYVNTPIMSNIGKLVLKYASLMTGVRNNSNSITVEELLNKIYQYSFGNLDIHQALTPYQRSVQNATIESFVVNAESITNLSNGIGGYLKSLINKIKDRAQTGNATTKDNLTAVHYKSIVRFITLWENEKNKSLITNL